MLTIVKTPRTVAALRTIAIGGGLGFALGLGSFLAGTAPAAAAPG